MCSSEQKANCININMCSNEQRKKQMNNMYKNDKLHKCKVQKVNVNGQWLIVSVPKGKFSAMLSNRNWTYVEVTTI